MVPASRAVYFILSRFQLRDASGYWCIFNVELDWGLRISLASQDRIRTASGGDRPNTQVLKRFFNYLLESLPVATARRSDFVSNRLEFLKLHQYPLPVLGPGELTAPTQTNSLRRNHLDSSCKLSLR